MPPSFDLDKDNTETMLLRNARASEAKSVIGTIGVPVGSADDVLPLMASMAIFLLCCVAECAICLGRLPVIAAKNQPVETPPPPGMRRMGLIFRTIFIC